MRGIMEQNRESGSQESLPQGRLERLEAQIKNHLEESRDFYFTEYLHKLMGRVHNEKYQIDLLQDELDRSFKLYLQRNSRQVEPETERVRTVENIEPDIRRETQDAEAPSPEVARTAVFAGGAPYTANPPKQKSAEFTVGVLVFGIVGAAFILISFVMLGMTYMGGLFRGLSLYAISLALFLLSELLICRKSGKLGGAISAIGAGGLYLSTLLNYLYLHNFGGFTAMLITAAVTAVLLIWSRKKDSGLLRMIGLIAGYLCFLPLQDGVGGVSFLIVTGILFLLNLMCALLPVGRYRFALGITHLISNTVFSQLFLWRAIFCGVEGRYQIVFLLSSIIIMELIITRLLCVADREKENGSGQEYAAGIAVFCISACMYIGMLLFWFYGLPGTPESAKHISMAVLAGTCLITWLVQRNRSEKWLQYFFINLAALAIYGFSNIKAESVICILAVFALAKLLSPAKVPMLRVSELIITIIVCAATLIYHRTPYVYALGAGLLVSVLLLGDLQVIYAILITFTMANLAFLNLPASLGLPAMVGIWFIGLLLFNNVERWRGKGIEAFNYIAISAQALCLLRLLDISYKGTYITYLMMLIFGLATIVLTFHEKYRMNFKGKHLILAGFLTYMTLAGRIGIPVVTSIILMLIALSCVAAGFALREGSVRIYGLILSLFVCVKVAVYDFTGVPNLEKMILFFSIGLIALIISGIYIVLEKKLQ